MSDQENRHSQYSDLQKPGQDQKPVSQPNPPVQQHPTGQPKSPQPEQEKHDQAKKQSA